MPELSFQETAEAIRDKVAAVVGVPVTVGIARTRTLAKLISDSAKPFGARAVLGPEAEAVLMSGLPVTEIAGISDRRAERLRPWGIETCLDLAQADRRLVRELLTASGEALWWELNGDPVQSIRPDRRAPKTLSRGGSFGRATIDPMILFAWLVRHLERVIEELEYHDILAGRVTVCLDYKDGRSGSGQASLTQPSDRFDLLLEAARPCLRAAWLPRVAACRMQLITEHLTPRGRAQMGLFDPPEAAARAAALAKLKREVNLRHGRFALRSAATLPSAPSITTSPTATTSATSAARPASEAGIFSVSGQWLSGKPSKGKLNRQVRQGRREGKRVSTCVLRVLSSIFHGVLTVPFPAFRIAFQGFALMGASST